MNFKNIAISVGDNLFMANNEEGTIISGEYLFIEDKEDLEAAILATRHCIPSFTPEMLLDFYTDCRDTERLKKELL